jgi:hypothetical protein
MVAVLQSNRMMRELPNKRSFNFETSPDFITVIKSRKLRWATFVAR